MDKYYLSKEENYFSNMKKSEVDHLLKKLTTSDLGSNTEIRYMNSTINKKNSKITKTSKKLKNCIENLRQDTQNFDKLYEKTSIPYGRTLNRLLPLTKEENTEEEFNKITELRATDYKSQILNLHSIQDEIITGKRTKLSSSPGKIASHTSNKFFNAKQYNQMQYKMHPRFVDHIRFIHQQIKFTKQNEEKLKTPKLLRDIKEICNKAINEDEITVEGVTLRNLNNFDVNREFDPNFLKILHSKGPLKAFSRYSNDSKTSWQPCLVVFIDDKDFFHIIWDMNNYEMIQEIFLKFWSSDLENWQNYYAEVGKHFKIKKVYRINLYFDNENHEKHLKRYEEAICAKIIYDYQNIYFKKISDRCSATTFVEKFNDISLKLLRINKKLRPRLLNNKEETIIREIFAFHKMAVCKVDIEMIENKSNLLYNFKPWASMYTRHNFQVTRSQINLLFNLYNFFNENEGIPIFQNKSHYKCPSLIFMTTSTNINTYAQSEPNQSLDSLGSKFFHMVRDYSLCPENLESKGKTSRFNSYLQEYKSKKLNDDLIKFFNIFNQIKNQYNTEDIIAKSHFTSIKNLKGFTDAYAKQMISSAVTFDKLVVSCLKEFRNINQIFLCDFLFTNEIVLRKDKFSQQDGLQIKMFHNQSKLSSYKDRIKLLIDISINRIDTYKEKASSDMFEKFKFEEDKIIFLREKEILNRIINYQEIYKLINKQLNNSIHIALGRSIEKLESLFAELIVAVPVDENLDKFFKVTNKEEFFSKQKDQKIFNNDIISLIDYFKNISKIEENLVDLKIVKVLIKTITAYYKHFHYNHINQDSFYPSTSDKLKLIKIKLKVSNRKKGHDHAHDFLNVYENYFNHSSSHHLDISRKSSISNSNDSKVYNNSYLYDMGIDNDFFKTFKIFDIYNGINLKFLNERKANNEKRSSNIFQHFQHQNQIFKEISDENFSEWQLKSLFELINYYDLELSTTDSGLNEVVQYFEDYFMERFSELRITKPVFSYNVIKKFGVKDDNYDICSKTKKKFNNGGLYSVDKNPNVNNLSYEDYIKYYESAITGSKVMKDTEVLKKRLRDSITIPMIQLKNNSYYGIFSYVLIILFYYPFYKFDKENFKKFFIERDENQNNLEFCDFMVDTLTTLESDLALLPNEVTCGVIVLKIQKIKLLIKNNIDYAKNVIFSICHSKIKVHLIDGEKEFLSVRKSLSRIINSIDDYIDQTDYIHSDNFEKQLHSVESVYSECQKNYSLFEKNFKTIDAKLFALMFESYEWSFILKKERYYQQRRLDEDRMERVKELTIESDYLINETNTLERDMEKLNEMTKFDLCIENEEFVEKLHYQSTVIENRVNILNRREENLNIPKTNLTQLNFYCKTVNLFKLSWGFISKWNFRYDKWLKEPIYTNNREEIKEVIENGWELCNNLNIFVKANHNKTIELISSHIYFQLGTLFKLSPIYYNMRDYIIKEWHWRELIEYIFTPLIASGVLAELPNFKTVTLKQIIDYNIPNPKDFINREIREKAVEEHTIETNLHKVEEHLRSLDFILIYWDQYGVYLIKNGQEVISLLKENSIELEYIVKNKRNYITPYLDKIVEIRSSIKNIKKTLKQYLLYQKTMIILVKVFHNKEVSKELQIDFKNFTRQFYDYKDISYKIYTSRNILSFLDHKSNIELMMIDSNALQMKLREYITKYKSKNPRFIFLSEESLLNFLSNCKNNKIFVKYISQIFPGVKNLKFQSNAGEIDKVNEKNITGIETYSDEILTFHKCVESLDDVASLSEWVRSFESSITSSLKVIIKNSLFQRINADIDIRIHLNEEKSICSTYSVLIENILIYSRLKAIFDYEYSNNKTPTDIFENVVLSNLKSLKSSITYNIDLIQNQLILSNNSNRLKAENLIIDLIQMREYIDYLITKEPISYLSYEIYSRIKPTFLLDFKNIGTKRLEDFYAVDDDKVNINQKYYCNKFINIDDSEFLEDSEIYLSLSVLNLNYKYGYELSTEKINLIFNPITDKTSLNLCSSLSYNFFTMVVGNKLAGKTQTVKGFMQLLAKPYVEWNCNSGENSYQCMSNILKQTANSGYYLIIEDVNCLQRGVLSSLIQNIYNIRAALIERNASAYIDNTYVPIDSSFYLYCTYCIYDGNFSQTKRLRILQSETSAFDMMPRNIIENFRFIYLIAPDYEYIIHVNLYALLGILYSEKAHDINLKLTKVKFNLDFDSPTDNANFPHQDEIEKKFILFLKMLDRNFEDCITDDSFSQKKIMKFSFFTIVNIKSIFSLLKKFLYDFKDGANISSNLISSVLSKETFFIENRNDKIILFNKLFIIAVFEKCKSIMTEILFENFRTAAISIFGFECLEDLKSLRTDASTCNKYKEKIEKNMQKENLIETKKFTDYLSMALDIISNSQSILILGGPITSKSTMIKALINVYFLEKNEFLFENFSTTTSNMMMGRQNKLHLEHELYAYHLNLNTIHLDKILGKYQMNINGKEWIEGILQSIINKNNGSVCTPNDENLENSTQFLCSSSLKKIIEKNIINLDPCRNESDEELLIDLIQLNSEDVKEKEVNIIKSKVVEKWILFDYTNPNPECERNNLTGYIYNPLERLTTLIQNKTFVKLSQENQDFPILNLIESNLKFVFETNSIKQASPSFVSRSNIVFIENDALKSTTLFKSYLKKDLLNIFEDYRDYLLTMYEQIALPFYESPEIQSFWQLNISDKLMTLNFIKSLKINLYELTKKLIFTDKISYAEVNGNQLTRDVSNKFEGYINLDDENIMGKNKNQAKVDSKVVGSKYDLQMRRRTAKSFIRFNDDSSISSEKMEPLSEEIMEAIFMSSFIINVGSILKKECRKKAEKIFKCILDKFVTNINKKGKIKQMTNEGPEKFQKRNSTQHFSFGFNIIQSIPNYPSNVFDFYFELRDSSWLRTIDYAFHDYRRYEFQGKFSEFDVSKSQKRSKESSRFVSHSYRPKSLLKIKNTGVSKLTDPKNVYVPTSNYVKISQLLNLAISYSMPLLIFGPSSSGKTTIIKSKLLYETEKNSSRFIHLNTKFRENLGNVQCKILSNLEKKQHGHYMSPGNKLTYIFMDDVNLCKHDARNDARNPLELSREWSQFGGWYDTNQPTFNKIDSISFISTYTYNSDNLDLADSGITERELKNFYVVFLDEFGKDDYVNILKAHFTSFLHNPVNDDNLINLILVESFAEKIWILEKYRKEKRDSQFINFSLNNLCNMMHSFRLFKIGSSFTISNLLDMWIYSFRSLLIDGYNFNGKDDFVKNTVIDLIKNNEELAKILIENKGAIKFSNDINEVKEEYSSSNFSENSYLDSSLEMIGNRQGTDFDNGESSNDHNVEQSINLLEKSKEIGRLKSQSVSEISTRFSKIFVNNVNNSMNKYQFLKDYEYKISVPRKSDHKLINLDEKIRIQKEFNYFRSYSLMPSNDKEKNKNFEKLELYQTNRASIDRQISNTLNRNRLIELAEIKEEEYIIKTNKKVFDEFNRDKLDKIIEIISTRYNKQILYSNDRNDKIIEEMDSTSELIEISLLIIVFLKSISFVVSKDELEETACKFFETRLYGKKLFDILPQSEDNSDLNHINTIGLNYSNINHDYQIVTQNNFTPSLEFYKSKFKLAEQDYFKKKSFFGIYKNKSENLAQRFFINIIQINFMLESLNNFYIIKSPIHIDKNMISLILNNLSCMLDYQAFVYRIEDSFNKEFTFIQDLKKIINQIIFDDKKFMIIQEVESYSLKDRLSHNDVVNQIKEIFNFLEILNLRMLDENFQNLSSLKKLEDLLQTNKPQSQPKAKTNFNRNFDYFCVEMLDKISLNLKIILVIRENIPSQELIKGNCSKHLHIESLIARDYKNLLANSLVYYFDHKLDKLFHKDENILESLNEFQTNQSIFEETYLFANELKNKHKSKFSKKQDLSTNSFEESVGLFHILNDKFRDLFKGFYLKYLKRNLKLLKYFEILKKFAGSLKMKSELIEKQCVGKKESISSLLEKATISKQILGDLEVLIEKQSRYNLVENYQILNKVGETFINSLGQDDFEDFKSDLNKKIFNKNCLKVLFFFEHFFKNLTNNRILKNNLSSDEKANFTKEYSNFQNLKENFKKIENLQILDKLNLLQEITAELTISPGKIPNIYKTFNIYLVCLQNYLSNLKMLLEDSTIKLDYKKFIASKEGEDMLIKQFKEDYEQNLFIKGVKIAELKTVEENLQTSESDLKHLTTKFEKYENILSSLEKILDSSSFMSLKFIQDQILESQSANHNIEKLSLFFSIYFTLISSFEFSCQIKIQTFVLQKLFSSTNLESSCLYKTLPNKFHKYIHKAVYFGRNANEIFLDSLLSLQILLRLNAKPVYIFDQMGEVESFLVNSRQKHCNIESYTTNERTRIVIGNSMKNGDYLIIKNMDSELYDMIKPILIHLNRKFFNLENEPHEEWELNNIHPNFRLIIIDSVESRLYKTYLGNYTIYMKFAQLKKDLIKETVMSKIFSHLGEINYSTIKVKFGVYYYCERIHKNILNKLVNAFEYCSIFPEIKNFEFNKKAAKDFRNLEEILKIIQLQKSIFNRKVEKIKNKFPFGKNILNKDMNLTDIYTGLKETSIYKHFKLLKEKIKSNKLSIDLMLRYKKSIGIINKVLKEFYHFSEKSFYKNLDISIKSFLSVITAEDSSSFDESLRNCLKFISARLYTFYYYSLKEEHFHLFGFLVSISTYKHSCQNEEEYLALKKLFTIVFKNKAAKLKNSNENESLWEDLTGANVIIPEILNNFRIDLILETFSNKSDAEVIRSPLKRLTKQTSDLGKKMKQPAKFKTSEKEKNTKISVNSESRNSSESLHFSPSKRPKRHTLKTTFKFENIKEILSNDRQKKETNINTELEIESLNTFPYSNYSILKSLMRLIPDFMTIFTKSLNHEDPSLITFMKNQNFEDIINNVEVELDLPSLKCLSKLQKLIFILTVKAELFYLGVQQFMNDHTVKDFIPLERSSIDSLGKLITHNNPFICIYYDSKCFNPMKIVQTISYNLNLSLKSISLGKFKINIDKLVSSFEDSLNQMVVFENVNLLDEELLPDLMKFISKVRQHSQSKIKQEHNYYVFLFEISPRDSVSKNRKFFKEVNFFYSVFLTNFPLDNIKSLMLLDYKYFLKNSKQSKDNPINHTANNSINSYLNHQYNSHKEKYNNNFQKIYSNSFLLFAVFLARNFNIKRLKIKKENEFDIDSRDLNILQNPYESMLMMIIFYEFINSYILRIITKLKENGAKNNIREENEYSIISTFINKKQIFEFICTFYNNSFGVENKTYHSWSKNVLNEILDFVINRLGQYSVKVYNQEKYLTPSMSKEFTDREIIEKCLVHFPNFDHPVVIGSNRNQYIRYLYRVSRSLFNWMQVVDTDIFNSRPDKRMNKKIIKSISISSNFLKGLGKNKGNKHKQRMSLNFSKIEKNRSSMGSISEKNPVFNDKSVRPLQFDQDRVENKEIKEDTIKLEDFLITYFNGMTMVDDLNNIYSLVEKSYEEKFTIEIEKKGSKKIENYNSILQGIHLSNLSLRKKSSSTKFFDHLMINKVAHLLENILKKIPKEVFDFQQIEGILSTNLKIIGRHTRKNSEASNQSKTYQDFFKKMNLEVPFSKRLSEAQIMPLKSFGENSDNNIELHGLKRSVSHIKSSLRMSKHTTNSISSSGITKSNGKDSRVSLENKHLNESRLQVDEEIKRKHKIETMKLNDALSTFKSFVLISKEIIKVISRLLSQINSNFQGMSIEDLSVLEDILNNKVPLELLKLADFTSKNIAMSDYLKWLSFNYGELKAAVDTKLMAVDMKKDFKMSKLNTINMIMNLGISYSIMNKVSLSEIIINGYFISSMDVVKEEGGVFLTNLKLFNCHYDNVTNMLEEQKDKEFSQVIPLLYLITDKSNTQSTSLDILIMNEKNYKFNRQYLGLIEEDKVRKKFFTKFKINNSKIKQKNLTNMIQMTSFLLKNANLSQDNKEEILKQEEIVKEIPTGNESEGQEKDELDDKMDQSMISVLESEEENQYDIIKDKIIKEKEIETLITTEYKNISLVDNFTSIESAFGLPNRVMPFRNSFKKNDQTKNNEVYNVRIPIINGNKGKKPHDFLIYLSFLSNFNQIFWNSMDAYASVDPFE